MSIDRDTLREFLASFADSGETFPHGAHMQAAGYYHGIWDAEIDYSHTDIEHGICEWISMSDAYSYSRGYDHGNTAHGTPKALAETFAEWLAQAVTEDDPANGGAGLLTGGSGPTPDSCHTCGTTNDLHTHGNETQCHACRLDDDLRAAGVLPGKRTIRRAPSPATLAHLLAKPTATLS